ncbi:MAG: 2-oxo acid dehydrogenase subunit E2 [Firmicutes bacterium]|nr:2-oxo acid dehydrogenase subunit E2 [Bacillota bacterium]
MRTEIIMPKLGLTMTEGRVVQWLAADGQTIRKGQPVVEVATDKIVNEVEAPADGALRIVSPPDSVVPVASLIGYLEDVASGSTQVTSDVAGAAPVTPEDALGGQGDVGTPARREVLGVMRRTIAERMVKSWTTVPHSWVTVKVNMENALRFRAAVNSSCPDGERVSVNDLVVFFTARALSEYPVLNSSFDGDAILLHPAVNVGIAVALEDGLIVPVIKGAGAKSLREIARESRRLVQAARAGSLDPDDISGGTFTVSNLGMFGVESFGPIINQPECAILAVGEIRPEPVVRNGALEEEQSMSLTLAFDHRVVDGAVAARFLGRVKALLEDPDSLK